jgi:phytoene synthase
MLDQRQALQRPPKPEHATDKTMTAPERQAGRAEWQYPNRATPPGSSLYYAVRFAPARLRDALAALAGWRHEVRAILDEVSDPGVARLKLDWWRDEIRRTIDGAPRHPLSHALASAPKAADLDTGLPAAPFLAIADVVEQELQRQRPGDAVALQAADAQDLGALFELMARAHGERDDAAIAAARRIGAWCAGVRRLRDAGLLVRRDRTVLPTDTVAAAGLGHEALASADHRDRLPELLVPAADALGAEAAAAAAPELPRALRIQGRIHAALLEELRRSGLEVVDQRIGLTPLRKFWIALRTK